MQWKIDFSDCGLVVSRVQVKVKWVDFEEEVEEPAQFTMVGDDNVMCAPYLGGRWGVCVWGGGGGGGGGRALAKDPVM